MAPQSRGEWLTRQMENGRVSVRRVADELGVTTKTVYDWQGGKTAISEERIPRLAGVLGVSEMEARRGLGLWVPEETEPATASISTDELRALRETLQAALDRIEEIQRGK